MTNQNYTSMTNEELVDEINKYSVDSPQLNNILRHSNPKLHLEIMNRTKFLDESNLSHQIYIGIRLYALKHNLTQEEYDYKCGLCEAKHQCIIKNNVILLLKDDINNLSIDMFR